MARPGFIYDALVLAALLGVVLFLLMADFGRSSSLVMIELENVGHVPLFGVVSLVLLWLLNGRKWPVRDVKFYALSFAITVGLGVGSEFLQALTPTRDFEYSDMLRDAAGALSFLLFAYPSPPGLAQARKKILTALVVIAATLPLQGALLHSFNIHRDFPVLESFEHRFETSGWKGTNARCSLSADHVTYGAASLKTRLLPGEYPGVELAYFIGDWRGYDVFAFDAFLEGAVPLAVTVRINDAEHAHTYSDRFNRRFTLSPGMNRIAVNLDEVRKAPRSRTMNMAEIVDVRLFTVNLVEEKTLYLDYFRLEKTRQP